MQPTQRPLTAVLGEPGQRDAQGFGGGSTVHTRPITITDAQGNVIYEKRSADNSKAADNHVRYAGYRRTSEWLDGSASVEKIPRSAKFKKAGIVLGILALVIAGISMLVVRSYAKAPEAAQSSCHQAVKDKLPSGSTPNFMTTTADKTTIQKNGGYLYWVTGEMRAVDVDGREHDSTYKCEAYIDSSGGVHKVTAGWTWK
ncbi:hypothetical protein RI444_16510 [Paenarthrobacter sp. AT5]|uniref:hypothetical protein n=1 Tax=Paenarthrobacter TaxID=1742992 RepID=UPI001A9A17FC|nr:MULTISPECIES: hypothetical protein [Paenarthrobacter]QSZ53079.1 hypothetical protein AYX19_08760 [Paenarthrobacter ureafaciens]WOC60101.1 hypothetical protein RI444_16510 [Paenarthrobacter sp. AT5]